MNAPIRSGVKGSDGQFVKHSNKEELTVLDSVEYSFTVGERQVDLDLAAAIQKAEELQRGDYTAASLEALDHALNMEAVQSFPS